MICFLDRSFCSHNDCVNDACYRNLTPKLEERAEKMELDVSFIDFKTDSCGYQSVSVVSREEVAAQLPLRVERLVGPWVVS